MKKNLALDTKKMMTGIYMLTMNMTQENTCVHVDYRS